MRIALSDSIPIAIHSALNNSLVHVVCGVPLGPSLEHGSTTQLRPSPLLSCPLFNIISRKVIIMSDNTSGGVLTKADVQVDECRPEDFDRFFEIGIACFAKQLNDGFWMTLHPGWDTEAGRAAAVSRLVERRKYTTKNRDGRLNTIFLKATVPSKEKPGKREIAGVAIWAQASNIEGYGDAPIPDLADAMDLNALFPGQEKEQRYARQFDRSFRKRRLEVINEISLSASPPAAFVLDLCAVDPAFQRLGIATKLVEWGLREAEERGGLEAILEASTMGRHVYWKLGFEQDGECVYVVDEEFQERNRPSNIFMRTGRSAS